MNSTNQDWITFNCLEVNQPLGTFYVGVMSCDQIVGISYSDVRRIGMENERREVESYLGIERPLDRKRVAELKEYVQTVDASFPSAVIVAVESRDTKYDPKAGVMSIRNDQNVAKILDGQHRIAGIEDMMAGSFDLIVTFFVDMDIEDQALVFATINLQQTKVNKSLAYDLFEYTKQRSPQKTSHSIVRLLDSRPDSPFYGKIKILGTAGDPGETLSQAVFIDMLLPLISLDPRKDRDLLKRRKKPEKATPSQEQTLIFRNMFLNEQDGEIATVLWNYFAAVQDRWPQQWNEVRRGYILNRTTGFRGLMLFLPYAYWGLEGPGSVPSAKDFAEVFGRVSLDGEDLIADVFRPGTSGQTALRQMLRSQTGL